VTTVAEAVQGANAAYLAGIAATPSERAGWLDAIAAGLEENAAELVEVAMAETHLTAPRLNGELVRTAFQLRLLAAEIRTGRQLDAVIDHSDPGWGMGPRPDLRRINEPLGVVGVFGASNFPFAFSVIGGDSASALAAGCAVVHKANPGHPELARRTATIVRDALASAGAPDGLFALVEDYAAGDELVTHPLVRAVGFTGSTTGGRALFDLASARPDPIPFYGELGSTNPVFVTEGAWSARRAEIVSGFVGSVTMGMGQFCTKPGFLFVPGTAASIAELVGTAIAAVATHELLTPRLRDAFSARLNALAEDPRFRIIAGSTEGSAEGGTEGSEDVAPTVLATDVTTVIEDPELLEYEMFGPAAVIVEYRNADELLQAASRLGGELTSGIHAEPGEDLRELASILSRRSGRVLWNGWPTGVSVTYAQHHGGPYPATTSPLSTSVGTAAIGRFLRPVAYQDFPQDHLPAGLRDDNPWKLPRLVDGEPEPAA
jgi:NADP-dependent aldehyde dehydrogenase